MHSLYNSMRILKNVYEQLVETSLSETGKPLAYVEDDEVLQSIINHVIESEEYSKLDGEESKDDWWKNDWKSKMDYSKIKITILLGRSIVEDSIVG